jgi:hypothetical protein
LEELCHEEMLRELDDFLFGDDDEADGEWVNSVHSVLCFSPIRD